MKRSWMLKLAGGAAIAGVAMAASVAIGSHGAGGKGAGRPQPGQPISLLTCPILRAEPERLHLTKKVPCFLARDKGQLYFLVRQEDMSGEVYPPQFRHKVLVEGVIGKGPDVCGAIPVKPVRLSVIPELDNRCQEVLPSNGFEAPPGVHDAEPSPREGVRYRPDFKADADGVYRAVLPFTFDSDHIEKNVHLVIESIEQKVLAKGAARVKLVAVSTPALLSSGEVVPERNDIGSARISEVVASLRGMGRRIDPEVAFEVRRPTADALGNHDGRFVRIEVTPTSARVGGPAR